MRINTNVVAENAARVYGKNNSKNTKAIGKLSSGQRITKSADDAAGLAISEKMRAQMRGLDMASKNCQDAISLVQTADGALQGTHNILQRLRELAVQASSDTNENSIDRAAMDIEYQQLLDEIDDTANKVEFNNMPILDGSLSGDVSVRNARITNGSASGFYVIVNEDFPLGDYTITFTPNGSAVDMVTTHSDGTVMYSTQTGSFNWPTLYNITYWGTSTSIPEFKYGFKTSPPSSDQASFLANLTEAKFTIGTGGLIIQKGANQGDTVEINIENMTASALGVRPSDVTAGNTANSALPKIDGAINALSTQSAELGAKQNRLEFSVANLDISSENQKASESRIRDLDMAKGMTEMTKSNILSQASTAMLSQANALPQGVLQLLGG